MKKKVTSLIVGTVILYIPVSICLSLIIYCKLNNINIKFNVLREIGFDKNYLILFFLILLELIVVTAISMNNRNSFKSKVNKITSEIETPVAIGERTTWYSKVAFTKRV